MFTTHDIVPFFIKGGFMSRMHRTWGKSTMYYCPKNKTVWQLDKDNNICLHRDIPSYGLDRKELPQV